MLIGVGYLGSLRGTVLILVFDSYAWVEYFLGSRLGEKVLGFIEEAELIYTPAVVLLEIVNKYFREGFSKEDVRERMGAIMRQSLVVPIDVDVLLLIKDAQSILSENTRRLGLKRRPSMIDYYIYALAIKTGAKVVTGDEHFKGLPKVIFLE